MNDLHSLEFVFSIGHIEVYKEEYYAVYYWKFFDEIVFRGGFTSLQTCMANYENVWFQSITQQHSNEPPVFNCPVIQTTQPTNNVIFVDFFLRKRRN